MRLMGREGRPICEAESRYPGNRRRSQCFQVLGLGDETVIPAEQAIAAIRSGEEVDDAISTLLGQASNQHEPSRRALLTIAIEPSVLANIDRFRREERRADIAGYLVSLRNAEAFQLVRGRIEGTAPIDDDSVARLEDWFSALLRAREHFPISGPLVHLVAHGPNRIGDQAATLALASDEIPKRDVYRALLLSVQDHGNPASTACSSCRASSPTREVPCASSLVWLPKERASAHARSLCLPT